MTHVQPVEWGDCDEAGIVFYPNYFYWFDCAFQRLLRSRGLSQRVLKARFGAVTPLVEASAKFLIPVRHDDQMMVEAHIDEWRERRFRVTYNLALEKRPAVQGFEIRAWAQYSGDGTIAGAAIDPAFRELMS